MVNVWRTYARCRWDGDARCTAAQQLADVQRTNHMLRAFVRDVRSSGALGRRGNGAFIYSCNEHVAGLDSRAFVGYRIGGVAMREALDRWWHDGADAPAARHVHLPCELRAKHRAHSPAARALGVADDADANASSASSQPLAHHECNPSCSAYKMKRRLSQECPCAP